MLAGKKNGLEKMNGTTKKRKAGGEHAVKTITY